MKKIKWGHVDLDDEIELDSGNISEWHAVLSSIRSAFERDGHLEETYHVVTERYWAYTTEVVLLKLGEFTPDMTWRIAEEIKQALRCYRHYWLVRIEIFGESRKDQPAATVEGGEEEADLDDRETLVWIEIDKYGIYPYAGKATVDRFDHIADFFQKYWGTDFGFGP